MKVINKKTQFFNFFRKLFKFRFIENVIIGIIKSKSFFSPFVKKLVPSNYLYTKNTYRKSTVNGINLILDISDYVNHYVYFNLKDQGFDQLVNLADKCHVIFDVGANIGFTALSMSKVMSEGGELHAFEPDPHNFSRLKNNLLLNPNISINIQNKGFGEKEGKLKLVVDTPNNLGGNRIDNYAQDNFTLVDITTIDLYCKEKDIQVVDLIKIDVEGYEFNVLKGAEYLLSKSRPKLFIEIDDNNLKLQGTSAQELISFLESNYNNIYVANTLARISSQYDFTNCHFDIIATNEN